MNKLLIRSFTFFSFLFLIGCAPSRSLVDISGTIEQQSSQETLSKIQAVFISNGFDIVQKDEEAGFLTTSYKKWTYKSGAGSDEGEETVILRLQMRATVTTPTEGNIRIVLTPVLKEAIEQEENKSFTESVIDAAVTITKAITKQPTEEDLGEDRTISYYGKKDRKIKFYTPDEKKLEVKILNTILKVSKEVSTTLGISEEQLKLNIVK
ncbi:MAG: hypothetical protein HQK83_02345 [Fibrobacteria bacterium]|nr:hypothetical protein [Fibrobacteria bacterium]